MICKGTTICPLQEAPTICICAMGRRRFERAQRFVKAQRSVRAQRFVKVQHFVSCRRRQPFLFARWGADDLEEPWQFAWASTICQGSFANESKKDGSFTKDPLQCVEPHLRKSPDTSQLSLITLLGLFSKWILLFAGLFFTKTSSTKINNVALLRALRFAICILQSAICNPGVLHVVAI